MAKTEMIRARVEPELKRGAEAVFKALGLSPTEAIVADTTLDAGIHDVLSAE